MSRLPVRGGISVTISPSSTSGSGVARGGCCGGGANGAGVTEDRTMPSVDAGVLVGISSTTVSSCFMISSASGACPGEPDSGVAGYRREHRREIEWISKKNKKKISVFLESYFAVCESPMFFCPPFVASSPLLLKMTEGREEPIGQDLLLGSSVQCSPRFSLTSW